MEVFVFSMLGLSAFVWIAMLMLAIQAARIGARLLESTKQPNGRRSGLQWGLGCLLAWAIIFVCRALIYEANLHHLPYTFYLAGLVSGEVYIIPGLEALFGVTLATPGILNTSLPILAVGSLLPAVLATCVTDKPRTIS